MPDTTLMTVEQAHERWAAAVAEENSAEAALIAAMKQALGAGHDRHDLCEAAHMTSAAVHDLLEPSLAERATLGSAPAAIWIG